jgi:hypothetical protein
MIPQENTMTQRHEDYRPHSCPPAAVFPVGSEEINTKTQRHEEYFSEGNTKTQRHEEYFRPPCRPAAVFTINSEEINTKTQRHEDFFSLCAFVPSCFSLFFYNAGCATILSPGQTLPADCGTTLSPVLFLNSTEPARKTQAFSLPKPYFQPYFLDKTTLVANKASKLHKPYLPYSFLILMYRRNKVNKVWGRGGIARWLLRLFCLENKEEIRLDKIEWPVQENMVGTSTAPYSFFIFRRKRPCAGYAAWIYCPFRAQLTIGVRATQGVAIGLGYIGLSARDGAMKNVCDKAKYPPDTTKLCWERLKAWHIPAQWHRLGLRCTPPDRRALKGQHTDRKIRCKIECPVQKNMVCSLPADCSTILYSIQSLPAACATTLYPIQSLPAGCSTILYSIQSLPADCSTILYPIQSLPAGCSATLYSIQSLPADCSTTLYSIQSLPAACSETLYSIQTLPALCGAIHFINVSLPALCSDIHFINVSLPAGCGTIHFKDFFIPLCPRVLVFPQPLIHVIKLLIYL